MLTLSATLLLSASLLSPFKYLAHTHKPAVPDERIRFVLHNAERSFLDIKIAGQTYTVMTNATLQIQAPVGTVIYADSPIYGFRRGDAILIVTPSLRDSRFEVR